MCMNIFFSHPPLTTVTNQKNLTTAGRVSVRVRLENESVLVTYSNVCADSPPISLVQFVTNR